MRDASGATVLRRFFSQGESLVGANGSTNYFYTRDHLGSVREAVGANGPLATRYNYDPYGQKSVVQENLQTTFCFTGDFVHQKSGLYLTWFRPLDSGTGRWLSRDPFGERASRNLYAYVQNNPSLFTDTYGLDVGNGGNFPGGCSNPNPSPTPYVPPLEPSTPPTAEPSAGPDNNDNEADSGTGKSNPSLRDWAELAEDAWPFFEAALKIVTEDVATPFGLTVLREEDLTGQRIY